MKSLYLVGQRFDKLLVLSQTNNTKWGQTQWLCRCVCGNELNVIGTALKSGKTKSCGCLRSKSIINMQGNRYGSLVVKEFAYSTPKRTFWKCKCDCGKETIIRSDSLRKGKTLSCGCLQKKIAISTGQNKVINELGNRYGKLIVIGRGDNQSNSKKVAYWRCKCDCGNTTNVRSSHLRNGSIVSCGCVKSAGELKIIQLLEKNHIIFKSQFTFNDLRGYGNRKLKFDFAIFKDEKLLYLIEYDGEQHFIKRSKYYSEKIVFHDSLKDEYAKEKGIPLIRINKKPNLILIKDLNV